MRSQCGFIIPLLLRLFAITLKKQQQISDLKPPQLPHERRMVVVSDFVIREFSGQSAADLTGP
jgi:hypothetical protein